MNKDVFNLTNPQKSIWVMEQFYKNTPMNNICGTLKFHEKLQFDILKLTINKFLENNDCFRLHLFFDKDGNIMQKMTAFKELDFEIINIKNEKELFELQQKIVNTEFDLFSNLYKFQLYRLPNGHGGIILNIHHLIADAFTTGIIANELVNIYSNLINNNAYETPKTSYIDYIKNEKKYLESTRYSKDRDYWFDQFNDSPEIANLAICNNKINTYTNSCISCRKTYILSKSIMDNINEYCKNNQISVFNFFMSVYSFYIGSVLNLKNFIIGTPILNRTTFAEKHTPGMFISTVPFKVSIPTNASFLDFAKQTAVHTAGIFRHQKFPYQEILEYVRKQDSSIPNLYNILISYQITHANKNISNINFDIEWSHSKYTSDPLDIHLFDVNDEGSLSIAYDYQTSKYTSSDIENMHSRIEFILKQILDVDDIKLDNMEIVTPEEKDFLLNKYNSSKTIKLKNTVIDLFEKNVNNSPDLLALNCKTKSLTYKELNNVSNYIAEYLQKKGVESGDKICLFLDNSIELVASILAILKLGACYIPIDIAYPKERVEYILENSSAKYILTNKTYHNKLSVSEDQILNIKITSIIRECANNTEITNINNSSLSNLSYIIYTSGSTGKPKGVQITGENLVNYITWANKEYVKGEPTNFPLYSSIAFDLTVTSVFTPLISGNAIYIYKNSNPELLLEKILMDNNVHILKLTPAHLNLLADCIEHCKIQSTKITKLIVGGDILTLDICKRITELFNGNVHIYNEYGPTEATVGCMIYESKPEDSELYISTPIGIPAANTQIYILNDNLKLIPFGYHGNLYIGGKGLSLRIFKSTKNHRRKIYQVTI